VRRRFICISRHDKYTVSATFGKKVFFYWNLIIALHHHNNPSHKGGSYTWGKMLDLQHQYNNPLHEGGFYILGHTLMWGVVVQLLYWCCTRIKFHTWGWAQCVGPTHMWGVVVQLLYWCCKSNIFLLHFTLRSVTVMPLVTLLHLHISHRSTSVRLRKIYIYIVQTYFNWMVLASVDWLYMWNRT
jgi:hypothetical protein